MGHFRSRDSAPAVKRYTGHLHDVGAAAVAAAIPSKFHFNRAACAERVPHKTTVSRELYFCILFYRDSSHHHIQRKIEAKLKRKFYIYEIRVYFYYHFFLLRSFLRSYARRLSKEIVY